MLLMYNCLNVLFYVFQIVLIMSSNIVDIGSKSGKFKYILVQQGDKYIIRGDSSLEYHGTSL